jgi:L-fuculose-phosphate aldolase
MDINDIRFKIAASRRMLYRQGCDSGVAGHVSARADESGAFWVTPFEYFDETLPERVCKVSPELKILEGDWEPSPAIDFHAAIYQARPDVNSVIHIHSTYVSIFATVDRPLGMYNVGSVLFFEDHAHCAVPAIDTAGLVKSLGDKRAVFMKNHGALIASQSLENATIEAITLEKSAHYHLEAERIGGTEFPEAEVRRGRDRYHKYFLPMMWEANFRRLRKSDPDLFAVLEETA